MISVLSFIFLFAPANFPENLQFQEILNSIPQNEIIIIFNSGGWGNTPFEKAEDFAPIIREIQRALNERGLNSIVAPYERTKDNFFGKITAIKEIFQSFPNQSEKLAKEIEEYLRKNPGKKIIIAGLSNGGVFVEETVVKISEELKNNVFAIEVGVPFWQDTFESENTLCLNNNGKDSLAIGDVKALLLALIKAPFKWAFSKINGTNLSFSQAIQAPGHEYRRDIVGPEITSFLEDKFTPF